MDKRLTPSGPAQDAPSGARWIRAARCRRRISQRDLAEISGVPRSTIERIEGGRTSPRLDTLETLLRATGFEIAIRDHHGHELEINHEREALVDRGDRRFPAHLASQRVLGYFDLPKPGHTEWWGWHNIAWPFTNEWVPEHTFWRRGEPPPVINLDGAYSLRGLVWEDAT